MWLSLFYISTIVGTLVVNYIKRMMMIGRMAFDGKEWKRAFAGFRLFR